jgi:DNA repair exonuclease SbcCD ATPase subunit
MKCCSIGKKLLFAAVAVVVVVGIFHFGSYVVHEVRHAESHLPPQVRLEMVKRDIAKIDSEIDKNWGPLAKLEGEIKDTKQEISNDQAWLDKAKAEMNAAADELEANVQKITYNGQTYTPIAAQKKLSEETKKYKQHQQKVDSLNRLLAAKEKAFEAFKARQEELKSARGELEARVAEIEAKQQIIAEAKVKTKMPNGDNSTLDDIKRRLNDMERDTRDELRAIEMREEANQDVDVPAPAPVKKDANPKESVIRSIRAVTGDKTKTDEVGK